MLHMYVTYICYICMLHIFVTYVCYRYIYYTCIKKKKHSYVDYHDNQHVSFSSYCHVSDVICHGLMTINIHMFIIHMFVIMYVCYHAYVCSGYYSGFIIMSAMLFVTFWGI